jgi:hypothetical protein
MLGLTVPPAARQDPVKLDPAFNTVEYEDDDVRVLRIRLGAGQKDRMHGHPASVAITLTDQHVKVTGADGVVREFQRKAGEARYLPPGVHSIENVSAAPYETVLVELKTARGKGEAPR